MVVKCTVDVDLLKARAVVGELQRAAEKLGSAQVHFSKRFANAFAKGTGARDVAIHAGRPSKPTFDGVKPQVATNSEACITIVYKK